MLVMTRTLFRLAPVPNLPTGTAGADGAAAPVSGSEVDAMVEAAPGACRGLHA